MSVESILIPKPTNPKGYINSLDRQIRRILDDKKLSVDSKYALYQQVLKKGQNLSAKIAKPVKISLERETNRQDIETDNFVSTFPKTYRKKAREFLTFVNDIPAVNVNDAGALVINCKEI